MFTNNSEYERGQHASPSGAIGGGSFGAMFLALILAAAVFVLSYMLYFGLIALVGGLLLMLAMRLWKANDIAFGEAFRRTVASFEGSVAIAAATTAGRGGYTIVARPDRLSHVLPVIYRQLAQ